jgi:hypothetical protein
MSKYRASFIKIGDSRYKIPPQQRKIGGKVWRYYMWTRAKADAVKEAERQTKSYGLLTKVVRSLNGWAIYFRNHD